MARLFFRRRPSATLFLNVECPKCGRRGMWLLEYEEDGYFIVECPKCRFKAEYPLSWARRYIRGGRLSLETLETALQIDLWFKPLKEKLNLP